MMTPEQVHERVRRTISGKVAEAVWELTGELGARPLPRHHERSLDAAIGVLVEVVARIFTEEDEG